MKQALFRRVFGKSIFQALGVEDVVVLGTDQNLWLEHAPFGNLPPTRQQIDGNVEAFDAVDANTIYVLGSNGALWLEHGPFGSVPPPRQQVDGNVAAFDAIDANTIYVLGQDGKLWLEHGPFNSVPPPRQQVDGNVAAFDAITEVTDSRDLRAAQNLPEFLEAVTLAGADIRELKLYLEGPQGSALGIFANLPERRFELRSSIEPKTDTKRFERIAGVFEGLLKLKLKQKETREQDKSAVFTSPDGI
jgi:hypothetical protein